MLSVVDLGVLENETSYISERFVLEFTHIERGLWRGVSALIPK